MAIAAGVAGHFAGKRQEKGRTDGSLSAIGRKWKRGTMPLSMIRGFASPGSPDYILAIA
jgi:hypothetical protein